MTEHDHDWRGGWVCGGADGCGQQTSIGPRCLEKAERRINDLEEQVRKLQRIIEHNRIQAVNFMRNMRGIRE